MTVYFRFPLEVIDNISSPPLTAGENIISQEEFEHVFHAAYRK